MLPTIKDVQEAYDRIKDHIVETPLLRPDVLEKRFGFPIFLKCENLQKTGSFKFRGAYNRLSQLPRGSEIVALSSGNHAQGVAKAAGMLGHRATIVMPSDAPQIKINNTRNFGAEVVLYNRATEDRDIVSKRVVLEKKAIFVHPFNDFHIVAGQGTAGLEIQKQAGIELDALLSCCSGGGLTGGLALSFDGSKTRIHPVEPIGFDDWSQSLIKGEVVVNNQTVGSICDGLLSPSALDVTWGVGKSRFSKGLAVSDDAVMEAMRFAYQELKLVVEPSGAVCLAALLSGVFKPTGATVLMISGGNVDAELFKKAIG